MKNRLFFFNNIKFVLTLMVILVHVAITYGAAGDWYYTDYDSSRVSITQYVLTAFNAVQQSYFMSFFFFISALFVPLSYKKRTAWGFIKSKLLRLGIPLVVYILIISPVTYVAIAKIINGSTLPWIDILIESGGSCFNNGPLWFVQALLIFNLLYLILKNVLKDKYIKKFILPNNIVITISIFTIGLLTFFVRTLFTIEYEFIGFKLGHFPMYIMMFIAGLFAIKSQWLDWLTEEKVKFWFTVSIIALILLPVMIMFGGDLTKFFGGYTIQSLLYSIWEPLIAIGTIMKFIELFRFHFNKPTPKNIFFTKNSYTVYIIHAPIVIFTAYFCSPLSIPSILKFFIVATVSIITCFLVANTLRKIKIIGKIL